jgi:hypothetical protein
VTRLDGEGRRQFGATWESVTERLIREAQERGEFDDLPGHGRPLPHDENPYAGEMALAFRMLRNAGAAPPWVEANKEIQRLDSELQRLFERARGAPERTWAAHRRALAMLMEAYREPVARLNAEAPSDRQRRRQPILADELARLQEAFHGHDEASPS